MHIFAGYRLPGLLDFVTVALRLLWSEISVWDVSAGRENYISARNGVPEPCIPFDRDARRGRRRHSLTTSLAPFSLWLVHLRPRFPCCRFSPLSFNVSNQVIPHVVVAVKALPCVPFSTFTSVPLTDDSTGTTVQIVRFLRMDTLAAIIVFKLHDIPP